MTRCPACHAQDGAVFIEAPRDYEYFSARRVPVRILLCSACRSLYQDPWPSDEELSGLYPADYQNYRSSSTPFLRALVTHAADAAARQFLARFGASATVLDYGCGDGAFIESLSRQGAPDPIGYDPNPREDVARRPGGPAILRSKDEITASSRRFDAIRLNHVIEHLSDVDGVMTWLASLLTPKGAIIGQTPNGAHWTAERFGRWWGPIHFPYHTILFSPEGLRAAASRWGLRLLRTNGTLMPTVWSMTAENVVKVAIGSRRRGRLPIYPALLAASVPFLVADRIISGRRTGIFDFELGRAASV
jgi:hypothetical protein